MNQDQVHPYQYCFNNPDSYFDPDGNWVFVIPLTLKVGPWLYAGACALTGYLITEGAKKANEEIARVQREGQNKKFNRQLPAELQDYQFGYGLEYELEQIQQHNQTMERRKKLDGMENAPNIDKLVKDKHKKEISHPEAKEKGHRKFKDKRSGEIINYDEGKPGASGHEGDSHYHIENPDATGDNNKYLDGEGRPCSKGSDESHIYPKGEEWWRKE
jgi:hypothetical protein